MPQGHDDGESLEELARGLAEIGRLVRRELQGVSTGGPLVVVRREGGDDIFGPDDVAHRVVLRELEMLARRWPGRLIIEGSDVPIDLNAGGGEWVYLVDPLDGTRPWLAGKRSGWVLLGAGREATSLEDLEVGAAVEVPTRRAHLSTVAYAVRGRSLNAVDDDMLNDGQSEPVRLTPSAVQDLGRSFVTVARFSPGSKGNIGRWEDELLDGLETYEDPYMCSGGQLMGLASGLDAAVIDPRPFAASDLSAHPYDLACLVVAREAGVIVESLPHGDFKQGLAPGTPVAWAGYANKFVHAELKRRISAVGVDALAMDRSDTEYPH